MAIPVDNVCAKTDRIGERISIKTTSKKIEIIGPFLLQRCISFITDLSSVFTLVKRLINVNKKIASNLCLLLIDSAVKNCFNEISNKNLVLDSEMYKFLIKL